MMLTWLARELQAAGISVLVIDGWQTRQTRPGFDPTGVVLHDTVTPNTLTRAQEQRVLVNGRPDLPGPLAQLGLHRDGVVSVIAAGRCSHNGYGDWGNDSVGCETFCYGAQTGREEPYNPVQRTVAAQLSAVICRHFGWGPERVKGHKETDPRRKRDPYGVDMVAMRGSVGALLNPQEDDMTEAQAAELSECKAILRKLLVFDFDDLTPLAQQLDPRFGAVLAAIAGIDPATTDALITPAQLDALAAGLATRLGPSVAADLAARLVA